MMMHHDARDYEVAAGGAAEWARNKIQKQVEDGRGAGVATIQKVMREIPRDFVPHHDNMTFEAEGNRLYLKFPGGGDFGDGEMKVPLHRNALHQIVDPINVGRDKKLPSPAKMTDFVEDNPEALPHWAGLLNAMYRKTRKTDRRSLVRVVNGEARSLLSPRYRRLSSGRLIEEFVSAIFQYDAHIISGKAFDTFFHLRAMQKVIYEPIKNEIMAFGIELLHGDHGSRKLTVRGFVERLRCTNLLMTDTCFSEVHLGAALPENIEISEKTMLLDTEAKAELMKDVIRNVFDKKYVNRKMARIAEASEAKVDMDAILTGLFEKKKITLEEKEEAAKLCRSADTELLPAGDTAVRLANALALLGQKVEPERGIELEELGGSLLGLTEEEKFEGGDKDK
jgi:hypothetical protein